MEYHLVIARSKLIFQCDFPKWPKKPQEEEKLKMSLRKTSGIVV